VISHRRLGGPNKEFVQHTLAVTIILYVYTKCTKIEKPILNRETSFMAFHSLPAIGARTDHNTSNQPENKIGNIQDGLQYSMAVFRM